MERATFVAGPDGRYLGADAAALDLYGVSLEEFLAARIGDFSGPYREMSRRLWRQMVASGEEMATGEATIFRRDGTTLRVSYERIARLPDGTFKLELISLGPGEGPPVVDDLALVLTHWQLAERDLGQGAESVNALRDLYRIGVNARLDRRRRQAVGRPDEAPARVGRSTRG